MPAGRLEADMAINRIWFAIQHASEQELRTFVNDLYQNAAVMNLHGDTAETDEDGYLTENALLKFFQGFAKEVTDDAVVRGAK
jgi:hypothetical protein